MSKPLLFAKISNDLAESIQKGKLLPGEPVPTVLDLQAQYQVSHVTVLRAYQDLVERGLVAKSGKRYQVSTPSAQPDGDRTVFSCFRSLTSISSDDNYGNRIIVGLMRSSAMNGLFYYVPPLTISFKGGVPVPDTVLSQLIGEARQFGERLPLLVLDSIITDEQIKNLILPFIPGDRLAVVGRRSSLPVFSVGNDVEALGRNACTLLHRPGDREYYACVPSFMEQNEMGNEVLSHAESGLLACGVASSHVVHLPAGEETEAQNEELCRRAVALVKKHRGSISFLLVNPFGGRMVCQALVEAGYSAPDDFRLLVSKGCEICVNEEPKLAVLSYDTECMGQLAIELLVSRERRVPKFYVVQPHIELNGTL